MLIYLTNIYKFKLYEVFQIYVTSRISENDAKLCPSHVPMFCPPEVSKRISHFCHTASVVLLGTGREKSM